MLIKDPSRFKIRNANSYDCVELYQLIKQCYLELLRNCDQRVRTSTRTLNQIEPNSDLNRKDLDNNLNSSLDSFEEFVDCLGFGKRGEQRKVLDCLLIEDLKENKIIALLTYSYGYFSYNGKEVHMNHLYVRPEYRLNGFGKLLFKNFIKLCAEVDLHKLKYDVPRTATGFCRFMKKLGTRSFTDDTSYCLFKMDLRTIDSKLNN